MDILNSWSLKIAKEVTPDKIDLAPIMTQAFVKGGKAREDLFYQEKRELGVDLACKLYITAFGST
ncbi:MAG: hypothetical protein JRG74_12590 [Deltaproteobacteria bacterium]|nr:hypothetical protein [Deltaproteobacteria bacterium]